MATTILNVPDISCEHCARSITEVLDPIDGILSVRVDVPAQQVRVEYDAARVGLERIEAVLAEEEYPVASVEGVPAA